MRMQNSSSNEWIEAMMVCFCCWSGRREREEKIEHDEKTCGTNLVHRIQFICFSSGVQMDRKKTLTTTSAEAEKIISFFHYVGVGQKG